jgi:hypothetical protein
LKIGWSDTFAMRVAIHDSDPDPIDVRPYGRFGGGLFTAHPLGLVVATAIMFTAWRLPEARWFSLASFPFGVLFGIALRFFHRRDGLPGTFLRLTRST